MTSHEKRQGIPWSVFILCAALLIQGLGGLGGGICLVASPGGALMGLSPTLLHHSPFSDFLIPGLVLGVVLGLVPIIVVWALIRQPKWRWVDTFNPFPERYWAWAFSLFIGFGLILWIDFQILFIGYVDILQSVFAFVGVIITVVTLLPSVQRWYTYHQGGSQQRSVV